MKSTTDAQKLRPDAVRLDKWLWAARFFKTRSLAQEAIEGGKVQVDGGRVKSSKLVVVGQEIRVLNRSGEYTVKVIAVSERRGPAPEARLLYEETPESASRRERLREERSWTGESGARPDKKQRRELLKLVGKE